MLKEGRGISPLALEVGLLILLAERPSHGYELGVRLASLDLPPPQSTQVYRALRRLSEEGFAVATWDMDSIRGPAKRVYSVTAEGDKRLHQALEELAAEVRVVRKLQSRLRRIERQAEA